MAASLILSAVVLLAGCAAVDRRVAGRADQALQLYPPTGQLIRVGDHRVHAHVAGRGPDVVLIHGASGNTRDFTFALVDRLRDDFRVIAFDRPGLGWSDDLGPAGVSPLVQADVLRAAAAELGVRDPVVLGHSYGAAVAMAWALRDPAGTGAVVALSGATMPWPGGLGPQYPILASRLGGATVVPLISAFASAGLADRALAAIFAPDPVPQGYADHVGIDLTLRPGTLRANARQVNGLKPHLQAMAENYPRLQVPVEIVHGTADTVVPLAIHAEPLARLLPRARLTALDAAGHMPHHTHAEAVEQAIRRAAAAAGR
ncbi:MAG: alpha/beta hydrolase [Rhodobacterales bacterium]|nr:alpha/beta hydrolase [Rhodobacterales bacterium]